MAADGAAPCGAVVLVRYHCADGEFAESRLDRVRVDRLISGLPVREFRWFRGRRFYSGWYWSATAKRLVAYESRLELARILLADFDRSVVGIAAQPFQLVGDDGGRTRRHVPDLLLLHESGAVTVVDVKPRHRLSDQEVAAVFGWTERVVSARGWAFEAWSGADDRLLANIRFLAGYRRRTVVREQLLPVALYLAGSCPTIGALEQALSGAGRAPLTVARPVVLHLPVDGRSEGRP
jgi:TnsA-like endonuclease N terminal